MRTEDGAGHAGDILLQGPARGESAKGLAQARDNGGPLPRREPGRHEALRLQNLGEISGPFCHNLNNLLNHIIGSLNLMMTKEEGPHEWVESLGEIEKTAQEAAELNGQLASLVHREEGDRKEPVHLGHLLLGVIHLTGQFPSRRTKLNYHIEPDLPPVYANPAVLEQAILSLLLAANRYDGVKSLVFASADRIDGALSSEAKVRVYISRTPVRGNPQASPSRNMPEPTPTHPSLPIVESIIRSLGGEASFSITADEGLEFEIILPAASRDQPAERN